MSFHPIAQTPQREVRRVRNARGQQSMAAAQRLRRKSKIVNAKLTGERWQRRRHRPRQLRQFMWNNHASRCTKQHVFPPTHSGSPKFRVNEKCVVCVCLCALCAPCARARPIQWHPSSTTMLNRVGRWFDPIKFISFYLWHLRPPGEPLIVFFVAGSIPLQCTAARLHLSQSISRERAHNLRQCWLLISILILIGSVFLCALLPSSSSSSPPLLLLLFYEHIALR